MYISADLANFEEEDILAQVLAQSQKDYFDTLKKQNVSTSPQPGSEGATSSSSNQVEDMETPS